jgi:acyl-CoA thioesterase-1
MEAIMRIVFLGDSVTEGCFELFASGDRFDTVRDPEAVYHHKLKKLWEEKYNDIPLDIINSGIGGDNVNGGFARLEKDVLKYNPDVVVVCFGLNDVCAGRGNLQNYISKLDSIFTRLLNENIRTIFMTPNMMNTYVDASIIDSAKEIAKQTANMQNDSTFDLFIDSAKELCKSKGIMVVDAYAKWKHMYKEGIDTTKLLSNLINHPTREMHNLFAELLIEVL